MTLFNSGYHSHGAPYIVCPMQLRLSLVWPSEQAAAKQAMPSSDEVIEKKW